MPVPDRDVALEPARRRARRVLIAGVALGSTGHIAAFTVAAIVAKDLLGSDALAGLPGATVVLGSATGSVLLSALMARRGRRAGLVAGYGVGVLGALIATVAVLARSFPLLLAGTALIGFGNSSNQLSRYAAADMVPPARRASAIGLVVWGATVGSVIGPTLAPVASSMASAAGLPGLAGPYLVPVLFVGAAALLSLTLLRPDPYELADATPDDLAAAGAAGADPVHAILRRPAIVAALLALVVAQITMTLIMTMTPLHMTEHGQGLGAVGLVLSGHTLGMYAFSPVSGWLTDRVGRFQTIYLGVGVLAASAVLAALAPAEGGPVLPLGLFLLGLGWSLAYVGGSALLSDHLELHERTRVQGIADALIWSVAATASLGSGLIVAAAGYAALGVLGIGLVGIAVPVIARSHGTATRA